MSTPSNRPLRVVALMMAMIVSVSPASATPITMDDSYSALDTTNVTEELITPFTLHTADQVLRLSQSRLVVVFWSGNGCTACKEMQPHIERFVRADGGKWIMGLSHFQNDPELRRRYRIQGPPTLLALRHGKEVNKKIAWNGDPQTYRDWINAELAKG